MTDPHPHKLILLGVSGSHAHGLATPESDNDFQGVFVYPTSVILGLSKFKGPETRTPTGDDYVLHEVGKFISLALAANPTILEVLYLDDYYEATLEGMMLVNLRQSFLSQRIRKTYGGYATAQLKKLTTREEQGLVGWGPALKKRREKHGRHLARLLIQGQQLLTEGTLTVRLTKKQRQIVRAVGKMNTHDIGEFFADEFEKMEAIDSPVPLEPDYAVINDLLLEIRRMNDC